jgi:bifunctional non-homologous end joining protein LigD
METKSISLYFKNGSSDKEYHATLEPKDGGFVVNFAYGRRGTSLTTGTKTQAPVAYDKALAAFEKLVREKTSKGYTEDTAGTPYEHTDKARQVSGLLPQLLNVAADTEVAGIVADDDWVMQEKFDGRRLMLRKTGDTIEGVNKLGLIVAVAAPVADAARAIAGDVVLDGEIVGDRLYAFDILSHDGDDMTALPYSKRYAALLDLLPADGAITAVPCWTDATDKADNLNALKARNAEGIVFKRADAPYTVGRPASGGTQLKFKFIDTLSAVVTKVNAKRSVAVSLHDGSDWTPMGNVTIPSNHDIPVEGSVVEVRYLYALPGGSIYQPVYLGVRDDIEAQECVTAQLKFKAEEN